MSQCLQTSGGCGNAGFHCCSNADHRLGKYHVPSRAWRWCYCCHGNQLSNNNTGHGIRPSGLPATTCAHLHCNLRRLGFILRHQPIITHKHIHSLTQTHMKLIYHPHSHKSLHLERMNQMHSFFRQSGERKMTAEERLAAGYWTYMLVAEQSYRLPFTGYHWAEVSGS